MAWSTSDSAGTAIAARLFAFDAATLAQKAIWTPTPTGTDGGIWQSGQGPAADADGNVYLMTGNGTSTPTPTDRTSATASSS